MKKMNKLIFASLLGIVFSGEVFAQTQQENHSVPFSSGKQNMWGPSWNAFSINQNINLFDAPWNTSFDSGNGGITSWGGMSFGAAIKGAFSGVIGSNFSLTGFTTGEVNVDYPIDVELRMTDDQTYDQGDIVSIQTSYEVETGYALETFYPSVGEMKFDVYFRLAGNLSATLCAFGCATFPVLPNFDTGLTTINIFTINASGIEFFSFDGGSPAFSYNLLPLHTSSIPNDPLGDYGMEGVLTIPYVVTEDGASGKDLYACGDSTYVNFSVDIFKLIEGLKIPKISAVAGMLSNTISVGPGEVSWTLFNAKLNMDIHNKQCFDFKPKVYGKFNFPVAVEYIVYNSSNNTVSQGTSSIMEVEIGNRLEYKYPCHYEEVNIIPTYRIDGQFTNHTYDSISFDFLMSAFQFGFSIPEIVVIPEIRVPRVCIRIPFCCRLCTPSFTIPAVRYPGIDMNYGPLWSTSIPLGNIKYDWYKNTWSLAGFDEYTFPSFRMIANKLAASFAQTDILCHGGNTGAIDVTTHAISPATPYTYVWTNGATTQDISGLTAGSYQVEIYDANDCNLFIGAVLTEPEQPISISHDKIDKLCNGGIDNGSIDILVQGGTAPYSYNWNNGQLTENISGLGTGTYTLTVTDNFGCTETTNAVIEEPAALGQVGAIADVLCHNDATGFISVNTFGGVLPYSYTWSSGDTTSTAENLSAGTHSLIVTDGNGCTHANAYTINQPTAPLSLSSSTVNVLCKGNSTGMIDITTTGGTSGYSYVWMNDRGIILPNQSEDISAITAGTYTVVATDGNGCTSRFTQTITEPAQELQSLPVLQHINCFGDATGQITPIISGGTPGYTYNWSDGSTNELLSNVSSGIYTLNIQDGNGCTRLFNYELTQPEHAVAITLLPEHVLCYGESTGTVISNLSGGTAPYSYVWNNGTSSSEIQNVTAGTYSLSIVDANGCVENSSVVVNQPSAPLSAASIVTDVDCYGNNSGIIDLTVSGGTAPYYYKWSNNGNLILTQTAPIITQLTNDTYHVMVTDENGCVFPQSFVVSQPSDPIAITAIIDDVNCYGMSDGAVDISVSGGTTPYSYSWSNGTSTEDLTSITADDYILTITDGNLCSLTETFSVPQPIEPLVATVTPVSVKCNGGTDGEISSTVTGGTAPYTYQWSNGSLLPELIGISGGVYDLTVTDAKGCISFTGTVVEEPVQPLIVNTVVNDVQCHGGNDGKIEIIISGGVAPYSYNWGNQNQILLNNFSEIISGLNKGNYFVRVTDRNGCLNEQHVQVNEPQPIIVQHYVTDVACFGDNSGFIDLTISGGVPNYTVLWNNGQTTEDAYNLVSGNYSVLIIDNQLCEYKENIFVDQPIKLEVAHEIREVSCIDRSDAAIFTAPYGGVKPYSFSWSNGHYNQNNENLAPGIYDLTLTDAHGCVADYSYEIKTSEHACVFIPNTITPNGDGYNDTWIIENIELYPNAEIRVFNKWGNLVYESIGEYTPWGGIHHGNPLPSEVYYYIIVLRNEEADEYTGTITIIR